MSAVGARALPLLCKNGRRCSDNADVAALIRSFLLVDLSRIDRRSNLDADLYYKVQDLFWDFVSVDRGMHGRLEFCRIEGSVHPNILTVPTEPRQLSDSEDGSWWAATRRAATRRASTRRATW